MTPATTPRILILCCALALASGTASAATPPAGPQDDKVADYLKALKSKNATVRKQTAVALGEMAAEAKDAVAALRDLLRDADEGVQAAAAAALEKIDRGGLLPGEFVREVQKLRQRAEAAEARAQALERQSQALKAQALEAVAAREKELVAAREKLDASLAAAERARREAAEPLQEARRQRDRAEELDKTLRQLRDERTKAEITARTLQARTEQLEAQLKLLSAEIERFRRLEKVKPREKTPEPAVEGLVKQIGKDGLLVISIGEDAGVKKGQTFDVYRVAPEPKYLGRVTVVDVKSTEAVGKFAGRGKESVAVGDRVGTVGTVER